MLKINQVVSNLVFKQVYLNVPYKENCDLVYEYKKYNDFVLNDDFNLISSQFQLNYF